MSEEPQKYSAEEELAAKREAFEKNPDAFVFVDHLIAAVKILPDGNLATFVNPRATRKDLHYAAGEVSRGVTKQLDVIDSQRKQQGFQLGGIKNRVFPPKGSKR